MTGKLRSINGRSFCLKGPSLLFDFLRSKRLELSSPAYFGAMLPGASPIAVVSHSAEETVVYRRLALARAVPYTITSKVKSCSPSAEAIVFTCDRELLLEIEFASHLFIIAI